MTLHIGSVEFDGDRVQINYLDDSSDLRNEGLLLQTHSIQIQRSPAYSTEIEALDAAALELLQEALDDFHDTDAVTAPPAADLEDEDD